MEKQRTLVAVSEPEVLINFAFNTKCRANIRLRSLCATNPVAFKNVKLKATFVGPFLLKHAVNCGDLNSVKNIIKRQKSIVAELSKEDAESLFRVATELDDSESMAGLLLQAGLNVDDVRVRLKTLDVNSFYTGRSELHVAGAFDRTDEVLSLLKTKKFDSLDCRDKEGKTPLHLAASKGNISLSGV
ncbi:hypothetical protein LWI29_010731 [Acer saccharum]|uniref:Uncharacterized protein n=1 Tax=Acer saccharum TaxID=4024 RepID=A0AA39VMU6_ACESA|nr:hypothetical protein LWI29_010731 [Acer saccharum]